MSVYEDRLREIAQTAVVGGSWDPILHPRALDGRFIRKGGWVRGLFKTKNGDLKKINGKVLGFSENPLDRKDPLVNVMTKQGELSAPVSRITEAVEPKAWLPWTKASKFDVESKFQKKIEPIANAIARVNLAAEKLSTTDPQERMKGLDKIMGGVRGTSLSTVVQENRRGKSHDEWDAQRIAQHEQLWSDFLAKVEAAHIPQEKKALALGGLPGSGKSFSLKPGHAAGELGVVGWDVTEDLPAGATHVVLNPDIMKELMIQHGMLPQGVSPLIKPMEQVSFIHAESNFLTALFFDRLSGEGYNVVYDTTMANVPHVKKNLGPLRDANYNMSGLFIDITKQESRISSAKRYIEDWQTPLGGRFVPSEAGSGGSSRGFKSYNRDVFQDMTSWFEDGWLVVDNTGVSEDQPLGQITDRGTGEDPAMAEYRRQQEIKRAAAKAAAPKAKWSNKPVPKQQSLQEFLDQVNGADTSAEISDAEALAMTQRYGSSQSKLLERTVKPEWKPMNAQQAGLPNGWSVENGGDAVPGGYNAWTAAYAPDGTKAGYIDYQLITDKKWDDGTAKIGMINVEPQYQRKGVAAALLKVAKHDNPDRTFVPGYTTEQGDAWWKAMTSSGNGLTEMMAAPQAMWALRSGSLGPEDTIAKIQRNEVYVPDSPGDDEDDYLVASTMPHEFTSLGRDDLLDSLAIAVETARGDGVTMTAYISQR